MNENIKDKIEELHPIKLFGKMIPLIPYLMFKFTATFIKFKSNANNAGKVFRKELIKLGIDKEIASDLSKVYMESSHFRQYIKGFN